MKERRLLLSHFLRGIAVVLLPVALPFFSIDHPAQAAKASKKKKHVEQLPVDYLKARRIGAVFYKTKEYSQAEGEFLKALKLVKSEKIGLDEHITVLMDLAATCDQMKRRIEAQRYVTEAINLVRQQYGNDSSKLPPLYSFDATLYPPMSSKRETQLKEALRISERLVGKDNPSLLHYLGNLHSIHLGTAQGIQYGQRVYDMRRKIPSFKTNSNSFNATGYLTLDYMDAGDFKSAEPLALLTEEIAGRNFGKYSSQALWGTGLVAIAYEKLGKKELAKEKINQCLEGFKRDEAYDEHYWDMHLKTANWFLTYGLYDAALALGLETIKTVKKNPEIQDPIRLLPTKMMTVVAAWKSGDKEQAQQLYSDYQNDVRKLYGNKHERDEQLQLGRNTLIARGVSDL